MIYMVKANEGGLQWTGIADSLNQAFQVVYRLESTLDAHCEIWELDGVGNDRKVYDSKEREVWSTSER